MLIKKLIKKIFRGRLTDFYRELSWTVRSRKFATLDVESYPRVLSEIYEKQVGKKLNLEFPRTYNEKLQWLKLYDADARKTELADKYLVKDFVTKQVGAQYVVRLLGVWDRAEDIDFSKLPKKFILKTNNGCHTNLIVTDKNKINQKKVCKKLTYWLSLNFEFLNGFEMQYRDIPRKIIAEEFIDSGKHGLDDYKVWCFEGKAYYIQYLTDRKKGLKMAFFDTKWNKMPFIYSYPMNTAEIPKPTCLQEMLNVAEKLAVGFHHVRVDFYLLNDGSLKVGELTFTPAGGTCLWEPEEWDGKLGKLIELQN